MGGWKSFDELEANLTLDELFLLYERTSERQQRMMKVVAASLGASMGGGVEETNEAIAAPIVSDGQTLFGYQTVSGGM